MEAKYVQAIKAGIIGGVVIGFGFLLILIINVITAASPALAMLDLLGCCILIIIVLLMVGAGALGVRMAAANIATLSDALVVSAVAGAVAGLAAGLVYTIDLIVKPLLVYDGGNSLSGDYGLSPLGSSAVQGILGICFCLPAALIAAAVLAVIGGTIYAMAILKIK